MEAGFQPEAPRSDWIRFGMPDLFFEVMHATEGGQSILNFSCRPIPKAAVPEPAVSE